MLLSQGSASNCRRRKLLDLKLGLQSKKMKSFRRKRLELRRVRSISLENPDDDSNSVNNKRRSEVDPENDVVGGERSVCHGKISVIGRRKEMEDAVAVELGFLKKGGKSYDFFGVYDGHGGSRVADECGEMMHKVLAASAAAEEKEEIDWKKTVAAGFKKMDEEVNKGGAAVATMGSTAVVVVVGKEEVVVANCGDSRAVLSRGGVVLQLLDDHKPNRSDELNRIEKCGGKVINWNGERVLGVLATSRSIGDYYLKPYVIAEPEVRVMSRSEEDEFIIVASDGLWDVVSNELACEVVRRCLDGQLRRKSGGTRVEVAAALLAELAMGKGSRDNISVIVVGFNFKPSYS